MLFLLFYVDIIKRSESTPSRLACHFHGSTLMSSLQEENSLKLLRLLVQNPQLNQRELASGLGVSLGKANYCLKALVNKGLVKIHNFRSSENKLAYAYLLTPLGIAEKANLTARFLVYKLAEYERLNLEIELLKSEVGDAQRGEQSSDSGAARGQNSEALPSRGKHA